MKKEDIMDRIEKVLLAGGIEFQYIWDENCSDDWCYLQCNVRDKIVCPKCGASPYVRNDCETRCRCGWRELRRAER